MVGYSSGQRGQTVNLLAYAYEGSNPSPTTTLFHRSRTPFHLVKSGLKSLSAFGQMSFSGVCCLLVTFPNRCSERVQKEYSATGRPSVLSSLGRTVPTFPTPTPGSCLRRDSVGVPFCEKRVLEFSIKLEKRYEISETCRTTAGRARIPEETAGSAISNSPFGALTIPPWPRPPWPSNSRRF